ncbi:MAG: hypothetical protein V4721_10380 [Bacteroidota bacterium]
MEIKLKNSVKKPTGRVKKYPFDDMQVGQMFEAGEYSNEALRSIHGSIQYFKRKPGNSRKKFSCAKTDKGKLGVWRDK